VFFSVGQPHTDEQAEFLVRVERMVRGHGLTPTTLGANFYDFRNPLAAIRDRMRKCAGAVIVGMERRYAESAIDRRGSARQTALSDLAMSTPWTHLEAGMAFMLDLPLLILKERRVYAEGILDPALGAYFVCTFSLGEDPRKSVELKGVLASWAKVVKASPHQSTDI